MNAIKKSVVLHFLSLSTVTLTLSLSACGGGGSDQPTASNKSPSPAATSSPQSSPQATPTETAQPTPTPSPVSTVEPSSEPEPTPTPESSPSGLPTSSPSPASTASPEPEDTQPDAFSFSDQSNVDLGTEITSEAITVFGINAAARISIVGGTYSIDGGSFVSTEGSVNAGAKVQVRLSSANLSGITVSATLTIGGVSGDFKVTTKSVVSTNSKPNIILVLADDISARELPIYGSSVWSYPPIGGNSSDPQYLAKTPVLDQLANDGVWIKTAWSSTVCSPTRAMMMTGRYAHLHKWWFNGAARGLNPERTSKWELYESSPHSIGQVAKAGGYATYWAGKTQIAGVDQFGFDEAVFTPGGDTENATNPYSDFRIVTRKRAGVPYLVNEDTGVEVDYYEQYGWYWKPHVELMNHPSSNGKKYEWWPNTPEAQAKWGDGLTTYGPDVELNFIFDFMERKHSENTPFFIYHTTHLGHDGWDFFSSDIDPATRNRWPGTPKIEWKNGRYERTEPVVTGDKGVYDTHGTVTESGMHSHVEYLDYQMWQYMEKLKELGIENNTILIFVADNGSAVYGKASSVQQRGTHVPLIIYAPVLNMTKKGEQDVLVNISDFLPTIADVAGVKIPDSYEINGESLLPFLTTDKAEHREWVYAYQRNEQLIRSKNVLIDGSGTIYDVSSYPSDLTSFPEIKNISSASAQHQQEYTMLQTILPKFSQATTGRDAPLEGTGPIDPLTSED